MTQPNQDDDDRVYDNASDDGSAGLDHGDSAGFAFIADDDDEPRGDAGSRDARRVGLVLGLALLILVVLLVVLLQVLGNVFGDMWDKVFTF